MSIHRKLFRGIYNHAGKIRDYNITKKEWVLDGATVMYGSASELRATLEYDFSQEKDFSYRGLSMDEIIHHLAVFISRLWQIHIFGEGNTRTTAVFFIKYLRTLGFSATNDIFADHAWYFRNALVRANYTNLQKNIHETTVHIHRLFEKFGFDEVFGRSAVMELLQLKSSGASKLISNLVQSDIIEPVSGHGKGKYKFRK
ncbi:MULTISPECIES: Fic family protein [Mediterraneibacter]|uniref:Fic family protein n=1 Tax=Mediterraneibacter gnavus TaxID=33038 RepID=UPI002E8E531C|nr:Fic family protein [Mediterraneibacter gnavus]